MIFLSHRILQAIPGVFRTFFRYMLLFEKLTYLSSLGRIAAPAGAAAMLLVGAGVGWLSGELQNGSLFFLSIRVVLNDEDGPAESGFRAIGFAEFGPPDLASLDYHDGSPSDRPCRRRRRGCKRLSSVP